MASSRYVRRLLPQDRLALTARDLEILGHVHGYRVMRAEHLHPIAFPGRTLRVVQARLRKLWQHGYLDRHFVPFALDGTRRAPSEAATPAYALAKKGLRALEDAVSGAPEELPEGAPRRPLSPQSLSHALAVTDLLAAVEAAALARGLHDRITPEHEWRLRQKAAERQHPTHGLVVPDGAVTFRGPDRPVPETWYVEIVRAGVSGGNGEFLAKMRRYLALRDEGRFFRAFRHPRVRGVLIAAPTAERARRLRLLAASLPSGARFFAFTHSEDRIGERRATRFRSESVLDLAWTDGGGGVVRLGHSGERLPERPVASAPEPIETPGSTA